jgi:hypothetical protein
VIARKRKETTTSNNTIAKGKTTTKRIATSISNPEQNKSRLNNSYNKRRGVARSAGSTKMMSRWRNKKLEYSMKYN